MLKHTSKGSTGVFDGVEKHVFIEHQAQKWRWRLVCINIIMNAISKCRKGSYTVTSQWSKQFIKTKKTTTFLSDNAMVFWVFKK